MSSFKEMTNLFREIGSGPDGPYVDGRVLAGMLDKAFQGGQSVKVNNYNATTAPTPVDDESKGYSLFSEWIDTSRNRAFVCVNAATGNAKWVMVPGSTRFAIEVRGGTSGYGGENSVAAVYDTLQEALESLGTEGNRFGVIYVGGFHPGEYTFSGFDFVTLIGSLSCPVTLNGASPIQFSTGYPMLFLRGSFDIKSTVFPAVTTIGTPENVDFRAESYSPRGILIESIHMQSDWPQLLLRNVKVQKKTSWINTAPTIKVVGNPLSQVLLDRVEVATAGNYLAPGIDIDIPVNVNSPAVLMNVTHSQADTPITSYTKFDKFLRLKGIGKISNLANLLSNRAIELWGDNTEVSLFGGNLGQNVTHDLYIDPAALNVKCIAEGIIFDPTKVSFPASARVMLSGVRNNQDGFIVQGSSNLSQLMEIFADAVSVAKISPTGEWSYNTSNLNWGVLPTTVQNALDRLANAVAGLLGGPIP